MPHGSASSANFSLTKTADTLFAALRAAEPLEIQQAGILVSSSGANVVIRQATGLQVEIPRANCNPPAAV